MRLFLLFAAVAATILSGCLGGGSGFDFKPGEGFTETGRTVHLRMWVVDVQQADIDGALKANLWAFCAG
jgi:hypothetical protein